MLDLVMRTPKDKYRDHKKNAINDRGIPFLLSFEEWWDIWQKSGHWHERGPRVGQYCMSRYNDIGPYAVGNVFIQLSTQNVLDCRTRNKFKKNVSLPAEIILKRADSRARDWEFTSPTGQVHIVHNAAEFCKLHNLGKGAISEVASGLRPQHKGWTCRRI